MLSTVSLLTALAIAAFYPFCFLISYNDPLKNNFHKFHLGLPNIIGGVVLVLVWFMDFPLPLKITITIWKIILFSVSKYSWRKEYPDPKLMLVPCLLGTYTFIRFQAFLIEPGWPIAFIGVLSGLIFCCILFAMNLGHWYLNVHGLPMAPLIRTVNILWILLTIRTVWDIYFMSAGRVSYAGDLITIAVFISKMDGFLLIIGLFFGTLFPLISLYFTREVLRLKNTQSATGILYVILCSIILGDMAYKYYLIKFGVFL